MLTTKQLIPEAKKDFLADGGVMGKLIRNFDWSKTSMGQIEKWSEYVKTAIRLCITSEFPALVYCGPDYLVLYNDAYIPMVGRKHPDGILGLPLKECRKEMWPVLGPLLTKVSETNKILRKEDLFLPIDIAGFLEEYYCALAYIPIGGPDKPEVILTNVFNNTLKVIQARQLDTLKEIELRSAEARSVDDACSLVFGALKACNTKDVPFALLYKVDKQANIAKLQCEAASAQLGPLLSPDMVSLKESDAAKSIWPFYKMAKIDKYEIVDISDILSVPSGYWEEPAKKAIIIPVRVAEQMAPIAFFIAGVSPRRRLDDNYIRFLCSVGSLLMSALANAEAYENTQKRLQSLAQIDHAKIAFMSTISHEFRTPLTLILGPLEQMLTDPRFLLASEQISLLQMMLRNTRRLLKLVTNVLDYSRIEARRLQGEFEPINAPEYTKFLTSFFKPAIEKAGLKFIVEVDAIDEPLYVDRSMWEKMIFNLLSNAFKYTTQGAITITLKKINKHIELSITDTGIGIAEKDLPHIFERFYYVHGVVARSAEGVGVGLSLSQELAKLHGGSIRVVSELNKGSMFTIVIPLGKDHLPVNQIKKSAYITESPELLASAYVDEVLSWLPEDAEIPLVAKPPVPFLSQAQAISTMTEEKKEKILVIDDSVDMRTYLRSLIAPHWSVVEAVNFETGIEAAKTLKPDLILCDVVTGKMPELELIKALRSESATKLTPIILVSASTSEEARISGFEIGADDYLNKPFSAKELLVRIRMQLELGKVRVELQKLIEELKKANESLTKSKENYRVLANMSPVGIVHIDLKGQATYVNPKGYKMLGLTLDASIQDFNMAWMESLHPEDKESVLDQWSSILKNKLDHYKSEHRFIRKDKSIVWVISEAISEKDEQGNIVGYILTSTDITRIKELLERQVHVVDSLCHELRNPLSGIHGNIQLLMSYLLALKASIQKVDDQYKIESAMKQELLNYIADSEESVDAMKKCVEYQKVVTDDVLDLSRLEAHKVAINEKEFDPCKVIHDAIAVVNVDVKKKEQQIQLQHPLLNFNVVSDPDRIRQVVLNLLTNAVKFTGKKGRITIGFEPTEIKEESCVLKFFVEDTGIGISTEGRAKLFKRFAQAELRTFSEYGGSGLGLSISKQLVELMGGDIDVTSTLGKGSRFTFTIKCKKLAGVGVKVKKGHKEFKAQPTKSEVEMCQGLVALIVEDNLINQKLLMRLLKNYGIKCYVASDGKQAVDMVKNKMNEINIILMDIEMPVMNGLDATKEIRSFEKEKILRPYHIIGISGNARPEYKQLATKSGMDAYFTKPYQIEQIFAEIEQRIKSTRSPVSSKRESFWPHIEKKEGPKSMALSASEAPQEGSGLSLFATMKVSESDKEKSSVTSSKVQQGRETLTVENISDTAQSVAKPTQEMTADKSETVSSVHL